jgi:hypothetical protein
MTRTEAEEIYISAILSGESVVVEMSLTDTQVFRVLAGRCMKEMERKNRNLWLKAREYGIEYKEPYMIIKKLDANRYKMYKVNADGDLVPFVKAVNEGESSIVETSG